MKILIKTVFIVSIFCTSVVNEEIMMQEKNVSRLEKHVVEIQLIEKNGEFQ